MSSTDNEWEKNSFPKWRIIENVNIYKISCSYLVQTVHFFRGVNDLITSATQRIHVEPSFFFSFFFAQKTRIGPGRSSVAVEDSVRRQLQAWGYGRHRTQKRKKPNLIACSGEELVVVAAQLAVTNQAADTEARAPPAALPLLRMRVPTGSIIRGDFSQ